eukprot:gene9806-10650_t
MGITSSSHPPSTQTASLNGSGDNQQERDIYLQLITPQKSLSSASLRPASASSSSPGNGSKCFISHKARIMRKLNYVDVWEAFLQSQFMTFALTPAEAKEILTQVATRELSSRSELNGVRDKSLVDEIEQEIKDYLDIIQEINEKDGIKSIDVMAVISSILLLNSVPIEIKIDQLFQFIQLNPLVHDFTAEDFLVALSSFERGVSFALGKRSCSESAMKEVVSQWMTLADPLHRSITNNFTQDNSILISKSAFFEFCTNRQHIVRRLLEALSILDVSDNKSNDLQEVSDTLDQLKQPARGGDEWMANPAWRKTAEKMIPVDVKSKYVDSKPLSNLSLSWIHGYRGFDCRNNIHYLPGDRQISFAAAAVSIIQDNCNSSTWKDRKQFYFNEHGDDIISIALFRGEKETLIASGEIGKTPAIYLYSWQNSESASSGNCSFESLGCFKGSHTKGVAQIAFSNDGKYLFSIGIEYSVAIYSIARDNPKNFGKLIASGQGPKDRIMHLSASHSNDYKFYSCGEKHIILWNLDRGTLKQENCKLGSNKNKVFLSIARGSSLVLTSTSEGELFGLQETSLVATNLVRAGISGHGKASINALIIRTIRGEDIVLSGDKDGKVILWRAASSSSSSVTLSALFEFVVTTRHTELIVPVEGLTALNLGVGKSSTPSLALDKPIPIRALDLSSDGARILVGSQSCEILEYRREDLSAFLSTDRKISATDLKSTLFVTGHHQGEVWGLARRPITEYNASEGSQYCTVGDDGFLRIWNTDQHMPLACAHLGGMTRAVDYSPDGLYVAIGFGGRLGTKKGKNAEDGVVKIIRMDRVSNTSSLKLTQVAEIKEAKQWISVVRYSPDGTTLAVGSRDNSIYLYSVPQQYRRKAKFSKHNAGINQLDFTADGKFLQSCCSGYEILFSDAISGAQVPDGTTKLLGKDWATWSMTLGWPVIGIWSGNMDGTDVNNVDRSPSGKFLATCDDFGKVNLFNWPAISDKGSQHTSFLGHSSHVTNVKWISVISPSSKASSFTPPRTDDYLISIGGEDKCVFQWKHNVGGGGGSLGGRADTSNISNDDVDVDIELPSGGDEFMAVKPWVGAIVSPTAWLHPDNNKIAAFYASLSEYSNRFRQLNERKEEAGSNDSLSNYHELNTLTDTVMQRLYESGVADSSAPSSDELELEYVYGYRGFDCRNNLFYVTLPRQQREERFILYYAAALGILYNCQNKRQSYFRGHSDDILSMAVCEIRVNNQVDEVLVATGQQGSNHGVFVWEAPSMQTLSVIKTKQKTILFLQFSSNGRILVSVGEDKSLAIIDWKSQTILASMKMDGNVVCDVSLLRSIDGNGNGTHQFFTAGDKLLKLWSVEGRNVNSTKFVTSPLGQLQSFLTVQEVLGKFVVGCEDGSLYVIPREAKGVKAVFSHTTSVQDLSKLGKPNNGKLDAKSATKGAIGITAMAVWSMNEDVVYLISGAKDGSVVLWDAAALRVVDRLTAKAAFHIDELVMPDGLPIVAKQIQAISLHPLLSTADRLYLLIGTRGCDVIELIWDLRTGVKLLNDNRIDYNGVVVRAHYHEELWGLASHPFLPEIASVGDDKTMRIYHLHEHKCLTLVSLGFFARCCSYSSDGCLIAVGFGGRVGKGKEQGDGIVRLYSIEYDTQSLRRNVKKVSERHDAKQWISDIKISRDQRTVVAGAHDCKIYIYNISSTSELSLRSIFSKHNAVINHIDLSADGRFLQSNCAGYELLFSDTATGKQITNPNEVKDVKWNTWTCTLGWPVQGIWESEMKGSDVNAVCRSHTGHLLATSDDMGRVHLFRYPVLPSRESSSSSKTSKKTSSGSLHFTGHSSHVMNIQWSAGDEYLISVGGNDKCIFQWKHVMSEVTSTSFTGGTVSAKSDKKVSLAPSLGGIGEESDFDKEASFNHGVSGKSTVDDLLSVELEGGGDESMAVKPWVGAVRPPKNPPPINSNPPTIEVSLAWIHGYSTNGVSHRQNIFYNLDDCIIYPTAALAISLHRPSSKNSIADWKQSYFEGHDDDVLCLTMSNDRRYIATGQIASKRLKGKASVMIWDALQNRLLSRMEGCHGRGVAAVAFNTEGNQLLSIGLDDNCTHLLWSDSGGNWSRVQQISSMKGDRQATNFVQFLKPQHPMSVRNEYHFISGNQKTLNLWKIEGSNLSKKAAKVGKKCPSNTQFFAMAQILSSTTGGNNLTSSNSFQTIIGTSTGDLLLLESRELAIAVEKAHKDAIHSLATNDSATLLVSGGKDGMIHLWNTSLQLIHSYSLSSLYSNSQVPIPLFDGGIIALNLKPSTGEERLSFVVGTFGGTIVEIVIPALQSNNSVNNSSSLAAADNARGFDFDKAALMPLLFSHCRGELWGLATHPLDPDIFATVGDDATLRATSLGEVGRWHPLGSVLAVALLSTEELLRKGGKFGNKTKKQANKVKESVREVDKDNEDDPITEGEELKQGTSEIAVPEKAMILIFAFQTSSSLTATNSTSTCELKLVASGGIPFNIADSSINVDGSKGKAGTGAASIGSISDIKFSPNGKYLIVGGHDSKIHGYAIPTVQSGNILQYSQWGEWERNLSLPHFIFNKHSSAILHFDCSTDSNYLQSNDIGNELLFFDLSKFKQEPSASKLADYNNYHIYNEEENGDGIGPKLWASQTCVFGWAVQGIWPATAYDSSDINSVDRHVSMKLLATGEDSGSVRVLRFPAVVPSSQSLTLTGHSSHVTNVRWTISNHLVSVGGNDKSIFIWQFQEK